MQARQLGLRENPARGSSLETDGFGSVQTSSVTPDGVPPSPPLGKAGMKLRAKWKRRQQAAVFLPSPKAGRVASRQHDLRQSKMQKAR